MDTHPMFAFLEDLRLNNQRDWFQDHKAQYSEARTAFEEIVQGLILELGKQEPELLPVEPKELIFKLNRDTRFSRDKTPYFPGFRAHISPHGRLPIPVGYYLSIQPGGRSILGGGLFTAIFKDATNRVREHIASHGEEWSAILSDPTFSRQFTVKGENLKKVPRGFDPGHPQADSLKNKSWYIEYPIPDEHILDPTGFITKAAEVYRCMRPFNAFLNRALEGFEL